jgi:hypothetical protein
VKAVRTGAENQFNTLYTVHLFVSYVFNHDDEKDLWCRFFTPDTTFFYSIVLHRNTV